MGDKVYNVGKIRALIMESSNEFKPVLGKNVEKDDKANNGKAYSDAEKRAKDFDGGLSSSNTNKKLEPKTDANRTTIDYNPGIEPSKEWKEKVEAQAKGYTSAMEEKNGIEKAAEFDTKGKIYKQFKDANDKVQDEEFALASSGLKGRELEKKGILKKRATMTESKTLKPKRLIFKHTEFLNEENMLQRIPEEYKVDGQKIYMQDARKNEYIVECVSGFGGIIETNVVSYKNEQLLNEQMSRIQELFKYDTKCTSGRNTKMQKLDEAQTFKNFDNAVKQATSPKE